MVRPLLAEDLDDVLRPFLAEDLDDVLRAWRAASRLAHGFLSDEFFETEERLIEEDFLPAAETWVVEDGGRVVGFIAVIPDDDGAEIGGLFVHPDHHHRGLGWQLVEHVRDRHGPLELEVFEDNTIGRAFYGRAGFVEVRRGEDDATGRPVLRLRLPAS